LIGHQALNGIIEKEQIHEPAKILEALDASVIHALKQDQTDNVDGMDICLIKLSTVEMDGAPARKLRFAGAKRNLYLNQRGKLETLKATRRSIGGFQSRKAKKPFTSIDKIIKPGDWLYLSSDGYIDQNNPNRVRFGSKKLLALLQEISGMGPKEQKEILEKALDEHKQGEEQRDDITLMGIRLI
jgi:serine phosphatase RsbU (regulator of sigma subunit)